MPVSPFVYYVLKAVLTNGSKHIYDLSGFDYLEGVGSVSGNGIAVAGVKNAGFAVFCHTVFSRNYIAALLVRVLMLCGKISENIIHFADYGFFAHRKAVEGNSLEGSFFGLFFLKYHFSDSFLV